MASIKLSPKKPRRARRHWLGLLGCAVVFSWGWPGEALALPAGVVIESVAPSSALAGAGGREGDLLTSWRVVGAKEQEGPLTTILEWQEFLSEKVPKGRVEIRGLRKGDPLFLIVGKGEWRSRIRPNFEASALIDYARGRRALESKDFEAARGTWLDLIQASGIDESTRFWLLGEVAESAAAAGAYGKVLEIVEALPSSSHLEPALLRLLNRLIHKTWRAHSPLATDLSERALQLAERCCAATLSYAKAQRAGGWLAWKYGDFEEAGRRYRSALEIQESQAPQSLAWASTLSDYAVVISMQGRPEAALEPFRQVLELRKVLAPASRSLGSAHNNLASTLERLGRPAEAAAHFEEAIRLKRKWLPGSPGVADSLTNLGKALQELGRPLDAFYALEEARHIWQVHDPSGSALADTLNHLGIVAEDLGLLERAEDLFLRSLSLQSFSDRSNPLAARAMSNLGFTAALRGDFFEAEQRYSRALLRLALTGGQPGDIAAIFNNLGSLYMWTGQVDLSRHYLEEALRIYRRSGRLDIPAAGTLQNLGYIARNQGYESQAQLLFEEALRIFEADAPGGRAAVNVLLNLGELALDSGAWDETRRRYSQVLDIEARVAPGGYGAAVALMAMGRLNRLEGRFAEAARDLGEAQEILRTLAPDGLHYAKLLHELGLLAKSEGKNEPAGVFFEESIDLLDTQAFRLEASRDFEDLFRARTEYHVYIDAISLAAEQGSVEEVFRLFERSRAMALRSLRGGFDPLSRLSPVQKAERQRLSIHYDRLSERRRRLDPRQDRGLIRAIDREQAWVREQQQKIEARLSRDTGVAPPAVELTSAKIVESIPEDTVMLGYSVGVESSWLIKISSRGTSALPILIGRDNLENKVARFRQLMYESESYEDRRHMESLSRQLYDLLFSSVQKEIVGARRLVLIRDGPLHFLPFAALQAPEGQYLGAWKPIVSVSSAGAWFEHRKAEKNAANASRVALFGDPINHRQVSSDERIQLAGLETARGCAISWPDLAATRFEVESISTLFGPEANIYLGSDASEPRLKSLSGIPHRIVHFATHACTDENAPWNSSIVLSAPDGESGQPDNGILQAWEIAQLDLPADLVVLSGCETALGAEGGGAGLLGLTRSFQVAGARSVLASLWNVPDRETADFMILFYRHLRHGLPADGALQAAIVEAIRNPGMEVRPSVWAGFQVYGY